MAVPLEQEVVVKGVLPEEKMVKKNLLLVFCKNPQLGKVKTRLAKTIGNEKALQIYHALLEKTADVLRQVDHDIHLYYSDTIQAHDYFTGIVTKKMKQEGVDLGQRMAHAFKMGFQSYDAVVIIGTDLWTLEASDINEAFMALEKNDAVVGPSMDGGYYLLGMKEFIPQLFTHKEWGTSSVLAHTLNDLKPFQHHFLKEKNDVDTIEDLEEYPTLNAIVS